MKTNDIALSNLKIGDIYYVIINNVYYFLQIIHIEQMNENQKKFGYFIVVFEKTFRSLPSSIIELDLLRIYQPKYLWKKTTLFTGIWSEDPYISFRKDMMYYDLKNKYNIVYFGNSKVSEQFKPDICYEFFPQNYCKSNDEGIQISYQHLELQVLLWGLEKEEIGKTKKKLSIKPKYLKEWIECVDPNNIIKVEKIIAKIENCNDIKLFSKELSKGLVAINKLDEKERFISTIEAESIINILSDIGLSKGLEKTSIEQQIEDIRTW